MPVIYYLGILRNETKPAVELAYEADLSAYSRFTRGSYQEFLTLFSTKVAEATRPGQRQRVEEKEYQIHAFAKSNGLCAVMVTKDDYPALTAQELLSRIMTDFEEAHTYDSYSRAQPKSLALPSLKTYITQWQDLSKIDNIAKVQQELDETKIILHKTIESVLERGEKLDNLVQKSDNLSAQSKMFYTSAKKQNSCCILM